MILFVSKVPNIEISSPKKKKEELYQYLIWTSTSYNILQDTSPCFNRILHVQAFHY